jgi:hypothetical protein
LVPDGLIQFTENSTTPASMGRMAPKLMQLADP